MILLPVVHLQTFLDYVSVITIKTKNAKERVNMK